MRTTTATWVSALAVAVSGGAAFLANTTVLARSPSGRDIPSLATPASGTGTPEIETRTISPAATTADFGTNPDPGEVGVTPMAATEGSAGMSQVFSLGRLGGLRAQEVDGRIVIVDLQSAMQTRVTAVPDGAQVLFIGTREQYRFDITRGPQGLVGKLHQIHDPAPSGGGGTPQQDLEDGYDSHEVEDREDEEREREEDREDAEREHEDDREVEDD